MGSCVNDAVMSMTKWKMGRGSALTKGELKHPHSRHPPFFPKLPHAPGNDAQVFGDEGRLPQGILHSGKKVVAGALDPPALPSGGGRSGDGPISLEGPEMVDAQDIALAEGRLDAPDPPAVAVGFQLVPVINGGAPQLAVLGEVVGRDAGDELGRAVLVQLEILAGGPDVGAVAGAIDGDVADELDARGSCLAAKRLQLLEEAELDVFGTLDVAASRLPQPAQSRLRVERQIGRSHPPRLVVVLTARGGK